MVSTKRFFYIPTYAIIIIFVIVALSLVFEIFTFANMYSFDSLTVGDTVYQRGEQGFDEALQKLQNILIGTTSASAILAAIFGYFSFKRISDHQG